MGNQMAAWLRWHGVPRREAFRLEGECRDKLCAVPSYTLKRNGTLIIHPPVWFVIGKPKSDYSQRFTTGY